MLLAVFVLCYSDATMTEADTNDTEAEETLRRADLSGVPEGLAVPEEALAALAQLAVAGAQDTDTQLAALMEGLTVADRQSVAERFQAIHHALEEAQRADEAPLTPEQQEQQHTLLERERRMMIAQWLSEHTLKKIRRALLMNPALFQRVVHLGEELTRKGVFFETRRTQITNAELGGVGVQPERAAMKEAEKDTGRSR